MRRGRCGQKLSLLVIAGFIIAWIGVEKSNDPEGNNAPTVQELAPAWEEIHNVPAETFFASDLLDSTREGVNAGLYTSADAC